MAGSTAILAVRIIGDSAPAQKSFKEAERAADRFAGKMSKITDVASVGGLAAGAALTKGLFDAVDADTANRKLAGQLNLTGADAEAAGRMAGSLYSNAYGGSLDEVNGAISAVASTLTTMSSNGGADVERLSKKALDLSATFGTDVGEAVTTAGILMKSGLAADGDEAMDLLVGSMQKVPAGMRAELLPVMDEYSKHFADLGIDGNTAFGIMQQAAQNGAIGMDKAGDALKEFQIRATDMSTASGAAYEQLGLDQGAMTAELLKGGDDAEKAFGQIVAGLQTMDDPVKQSQAALALFGTPLEDLSVAQIPEFLGAIDPMGDAFDSLAGSADKLGETVSTGPGVALESFSRKALASFQEIAAGALPFIQPVLDQLLQFTPILGPAAVALAAVAAVVWLVNGAMMAYNAALAIGRGAVLIATGAQWAWNAAMSANPIGVVILLIAGLVAGLVWAYNNVGWFRDAVDGMGKVAVAVWESIVKWVGDVINWLDDLLAPIGGIDGAIAGLKTAADIAFGGINSAIQGTIKWVQDAIGWFQSLFGAKNDAASAGGGGGGGGGAAPLMAAPMGFSAMSLMSAEAQPLVGASSLSSSSVPVGIASGLGSLARAGAAAGGDTYIELNVSADATTDGVQLGRTLLKTINKALSAQGKPKLAIS